MPNKNMAKVGRRHNEGHSCYYGCTKPAKSRCRTCPEMDCTERIAMSKFPNNGVNLPTDRCIIVVKKLASGATSMITCATPANKCPKGSRRGEFTVQCLLIGPRPCDQCPHNTDDWKGKLHIDIEKGKVTYCEYADVCPCANNKELNKKYRALVKGKAKKKVAP